MISLPQISGPIGFLVNTYPKLSETFIAGEIAGLERLGLSIHVYSLNNPTDDVFHSRPEAVDARVSYVSRIAISHAWALVKANLKLLLKTPKRYFNTLVCAIRYGDAGRVRQFLQAVSLVEPLNTDGIIHVHAHFISAPAGVAELIQRLTGISFSVSAHAKDIYLSSPQSLRRKMSRARFTVTCTEYNRKYLASLISHDARVYQMYHGIDTDRFSPDIGPDQKNARTTPPIILSVGRLREKKGFAVLIDACRQLRDAGHSVRCQIVGYGPDRDLLDELIKAHALEDVVELLGKLTHDALVDLYRRASIFALPCQVAGDGDRDGIPNVLLEAMAMRLPVVSTIVSGIPEVINHRSNGFLVAPKDSKSLARAIESLLQHPDERQRLGIAGRETVRQMFSNAINLTRLRDLLLDAPRLAIGRGISAAVGARLYE